MKKYLSYSILAIILVIGFSSCKGRKGVFTPTSSGRPYEILVVIGHDLWEQQAGRALYDVLVTDVPGLPQPERSFLLMFSAPKVFY